ncbi:MAG: histidine kinase [Acidobacteria bacterium]|nr:histidine kinase [Acidobacteriota bacterium]
MVKRGQAQLAEIFQADVHIALSSNSAAKQGLDVILEVGIESHGERVGIIQLGRRANQAPYLSEDIALLTSLVDTFSFVLENIRLQVRKQELTLKAVRSELKALRAQINPHFLFNALNAVAGLIHKDPVRAEETVEQLSEVFRYTLARSEKEWVRLQEELDFVRSYLDVEQVRFGDRLQVRIEIEPGAEKAAIPAMMVQTLVENAIKHGVASVRGVGVVEIQARHTGSQLWIQVSDNGPGFRETPNPESASQSTSTGHGLKNIRERLQGYFGDAAILKAEHDESRGKTVVSVEMPMFTSALAEGVTIR